MQVKWRLYRYSYELVTTGKEWALHYFLYKEGYSSPTSSNNDSETSRNEIWIICSWPVRKICDNIQVRMYMLMAYIRYEVIINLDECWRKVYQQSHRLLVSGTSRVLNRKFLQHRPIRIPIWISHSIKPEISLLCIVLFIRYKKNFR